MVLSRFVGVPEDIVFENNTGMKSLETPEPTPISQSPLNTPTVKTPNKPKAAPKPEPASIPNNPPPKVEKPKTPEPPKSVEQQPRVEKPESNPVPIKPKLAAPKKPTGFGRTPKPPVIQDTPKNEPTAEIEEPIEITEEDLLPEEVGNPQQNYEGAVGDMISTKDGQEVQIIGIEKNPDGSLVFSIMGENQKVRTIGKDQIGEIIATGEDLAYVDDFITEEETQTWNREVKPEDVSPELVEHIKKWESKIPNFAKDAFRSYVDLDPDPEKNQLYAIHLNAAMRNGTMTQQQKSNVKILVDAINQAGPLPKPQMIYRSIRFQLPWQKDYVSKTMSEFRRSQENGETVSFKTLTSTTLNPLYASRYLKDTNTTLVFAIKARTGVFVSPFSRMGGLELEILQNPGVQYRVLRILENTPFGGEGKMANVVQLEEI